MVIPAPNDIEFSGERKRVRCNEGLGPTQPHPTREGVQARKGSERTPATKPEAQTFPETGDLGNGPSDEARGRMPLLTAMHGPRDVRAARHSD